MNIAWDDFRCSSQKLAGTTPLNSLVSIVDAAKPILAVSMSMLLSKALSSRPMIKYQALA